jgi:signal transduction histidine kinase
MNSGPASDLSLLQLLQKQLPTLKPTVVDWPAFDRTILGVLQFLGERQIKSTLWVKLPLSSSSARAVDAHSQTGLAERIYRCQLAELPVAQSQLPKERRQLPTGQIPLVLETNSYLKREFFLLVLAPHFCFLLLAQDRTELPSPNSSAETPSSFKAISSFSPSSIVPFLNGIRQALTVTDNTPEDLLADSASAFSLPTALDVDLASDFWQQLLQFSARNSPPAPSKPSLETIPSPFLSADSRFLKQLTQELSLPLTNMKTALRLLDSMQHKREQRQRYLNLLQKECDRQSLLLAGLQEMVEINEVPPENQVPVRLEDLIPGIVSTYQPLAEEKGIRLGYTVPAGLPYVACPSASLRQILRNLLHNSLKFTPASGRVYVQAEHKDDDRIEITVSDTGVGIESRDLPHIFEPFFRSRNLPPEEVEGVGLGLMVVKYLIEECRGKISIYSKPQKGTQIKLSLMLLAT